MGRPLDAGPSMLPKRGALMDWSAFFSDEGRVSGSPQKDRQLMVEKLGRLGIRDERVLEAMSRVPRHRFVHKADWERAYVNRPLPIEAGQTISQPYIVALMTEALRLADEDRVLEIGTGSGYQTAILAELSHEVYSIERSEELSELAQERLEALGYDNVHLKQGDGTLGWPEHAPYDAIIGTGAVPEVPPALLEQLAEVGRLALPVGGRRLQQLVLMEQHEDHRRKHKLCDCSFLPLVGRQGWVEEERSSHS